MGDALHGGGAWATDDGVWFEMQCQYCSKQFYAYLRTDEEWTRDKDEGLRNRVCQHTVKHAMVPWDDILQLPIKCWKGDWSTKLDMPESEAGGSGGGRLSPHPFVCGPFGGLTPLLHAQCCLVFQNRHGTEKPEAKWPELTWGRTEWWFAVQGAPFQPCMAWGDRIMWSVACVMPAAPRAGVEGTAGHKVWWSGLRSVCPAATTPEARTTTLVTSTHQHRQQTLEQRQHKKSNINHNSTTVSFWLR